MCDIYKFKSLNMRCQNRTKFTILKKNERGDFGDTKKSPRKMEAEVWKRIVIDGQDHNYELTNLGHVRRLNTKKNMSLSSRGRYVACHLTHNGRRRTHLVHRLVGCKPTQFVMGESYQSQQA